jgi:uncharacterized protein YbdZ (MbtH family)
MAQKYIFKTLVGISVFLFLYGCAGLEHKPAVIAEEKKAVVTEEKPADITEAKKADIISESDEKLDRNEMIELGTGRADSPQVALDASGNAFVVWKQHDGTTFNILATRYDRKKGWDSPELLETGSGEADDPRVLFDPEGNAITVWAQSDGKTYSIWANRFDRDKGWGTPELIESGSHRADYPDVSFDPEGNAIAVWQQHDGTDFSIWANRFKRNTGWGTPELIEKETGPAKHQQIAFDLEGNTIAVWYQHDVKTFNIWSNRYDIDKGWGKAELIENGSGDAFDPKIASASNGNAIAVWIQDDGTAYSIWANRYDRITGWGKAELIETRSGDVNYPEIAFDSEA